MSTTEVTVYLSHKQVKDKYITPFGNPHYFYSRDNGFIAWRMGTGLNIELLHIRAWELRKGSGRKLLYHMLNRLGTEPDMRPYHSVYGFTLVTNERAIEFYESMGFDIQHLYNTPGIYKDAESTVLFSQRFTTLLETMQAYEKATKVDSNIITLPIRYVFPLPR